MALSTDTKRMLEAASQLESIRNEVMSSLGRYMTMNQDLTSGPFTGSAALASMRTTGDISTTGKQVSARFQACIDQIRASAHQYAQMNEQNAANLGGIAT
jgi:uncharacterized protein YukE